MPGRIETLALSRSGTSEWTTAGAVKAWVARAPLSGSAVMSSVGRVAPVAGRMEASTPAKPGFSERTTAAAARAWEAGGPRSWPRSGASGGSPFRSEEETGQAAGTVAQRHAGPEWGPPAARPQGPQAEASAQSHDGRMEAPAFPTSSSSGRTTAAAARVWFAQGPRSWSAAAHSRGRRRAGDVEATSPSIRRGASAAAPRW